MVENSMPGLRGRRLDHEIIPQVKEAGQGSGKSIAACHCERFLRSNLLEHEIATPQAGQVLYLPVQVARNDRHH
jgi:hypothetical protein